jgi:hypothetical protein
MRVLRAALVMTAASLAACSASPHRTPEVAVAGSAEAHAPAPEPHTVAGAAPTPSVADNVDGARRDYERARVPRGFSFVYSHISGGLYGEGTGAAVASPGCRRGCVHLVPGEIEQLAALLDRYSFWTMTDLRGDCNDCGEECIEGWTDRAHNKVCRDLYTSSKKPFRADFEALAEATVRIFTGAIERERRTRSARE